MANQKEVHTFIDRFSDPLLGYIVFRGYVDPLLGLEHLQGIGKIAARVVSDRNRLVVTPEIEETGTFTLEYKESNKLLDAFREERRAIITIEKKPRIFELRFITQ